MIPLGSLIALFASQGLADTTSSKASKASSSAPRSAVSHTSTKYDGPNAPSGGSPRSPQQPSPKDATRSPDAEGTPTPSVSGTRVTNTKNLDLGAAQWSVVHGYEVPTNLPLRPHSATKLGQEAKVALNTFTVTSHPTKPVFQYEIMIGNGAEKRGVITKVWHSKKAQERLDGQIIFNGDGLVRGP